MYTMDPHHDVAAPHCPALCRATADSPLHILYCWCNQMNSGVQKAGTIGISGHAVFNIAAGSWRGTGHGEPRPLHALGTVKFTDPSLTVSSYPEEGRRTVLMDSVEQVHRREHPDAMETRRWMSNTTYPIPMTRLQRC